MLKSMVCPIRCAFAAARGKSIPASTRDMLRGHAWHGNVRELRNVIERAVWLSRGDDVSAGAIHEAMGIGATCGTVVDSAEHHARVELIRVCEAEAWDAGRIAGRLGVGRTTLYRRLVESGISLRERKRLVRFSPDPRTGSRYDGK